MSTTSLNRVRSMVRTPVPGRALLALGAAAGPAYLAIGAAEIVLNRGFDPLRHSLSLLANGEGGWVHQTMMVCTGLATMAGATALGRRWGRGVPWLVGLYGAGVAAAGVAKADAMDGFPPGTPAGMPVDPTLSGTLHFVFGSLGFVGLIAACGLVASALARRGERTPAIASAAVAVGFTAAFVGIATGAGNAPIIVAFYLAVIAGWSWLTWLFLRTRSTAREA